MKTAVKHRKHSKFGFLSLGISVCAMSFIIYVANSAMQYIMQNPNITNELSLQECIRIPEKVMNWINLLIILPIIGLGLGIFGLCERDSKNLFPLIGVIVNTGLFLISPVWLYI